MKRSSTLTKLLGGLLVALIALLTTNGLQALADTYPDPERPGRGTPENPEQAVVTKHLEMPIGTTPPATTFTFDFTALGTATNPFPPNTQDGVALSTLTAPAVGSVNAAFTTTTPTEVQPAPRADVIRATIHTSDALNGIVWPGSGVFVYQVTERTDTFTNTAREHMYFDTIQYNLYVTIGEAADGTFYVRGSHAWERDPETGANVGPKLNPNPWRPGPGAIEGGSDLIFRNRFIRRTDDTSTTPGPGRPVLPGPGTSVPGPGDTPNPGVPGGLESALIISKRVTGSMASANSTFTFTGALTHTTLVNEVVTDVTEAAVTYGPVVAWVYHNNGTNFVRGRRAPAGTLPASYTFTPGTTPGETGPLTTFELRHGEVLIFERAPIGNIFVSTETDSLVYHPSIDLMVNGQAITPRASLNTPGTIGTNDVGTAPHRLGEASNIAAFTNMNDPVPITGLIMNNLPIILVTVGVMGLGAVTIVSKKRRSYA